jgi:isoamylase
VLRRRRFFVGEFKRPDLPATTRVGHDAAPGPFPSAGPVRPGEAGLAGEARLPGGLTTTPPPGVPAGLADIHWHGVEPFRPDFSYHSRSLAFTLDGRFTSREHDPDYRIDADFYVALSAWRLPLEFVIPPAPTRRRWRRVIDTARPSPDDFIPEGEGPLVPEGSAYSVAPFSVLVLVSEGS